MGSFFFWHISRGGVGPLVEAVANLRFLNEVENVKEGASHVGHVKMFHFHDTKSKISPHPNLFLFG